MDPPAYSRGKVVVNGMTFTGDEFLEDEAGTEVTRKISTLLMNFIDLSNQNIASNSSVIQERIA